jgi:hypothetical protein
MAFFQGTSSKTLLRYLKLIVRYFPLLNLQQEQMIIEWLTIQKIKSLSLRLEPSKFICEIGFERTVVNVASLRGHIDPGRLQVER